MAPKLAPSSIHDFQNKLVSRSFCQKIQDRINLPQQQPQVQSVLGQSSRVPNNVPEHVWYTAAAAFISRDFAGSKFQLSGNRLKSRFSENAKENSAAEKVCTSDLNLRVHPSKIKFSARQASKLNLLLGRICPFYQSSASARHLQRQLTRPWCNSCSCEGF